MKKRYSRIRNTYKKAVVSGKGRDDVAKEENDLREYVFLTWLDPFIKSRKTKTNAPSYNCDYMQVNVNDDYEEPPEETPETQEFDQICGGDQQLEQQLFDSNESVEYPPKSPTVVNIAKKTMISRSIDEATSSNRRETLTLLKENILSRESKSIGAANETGSLTTESDKTVHVNKIRPKITSKVTGKEKWTKKKEPNQKADDVEKKILSTMDNINNRLIKPSQAETEKDEDDLFGEMIVKELKKLSRPIKFQFKHEVNNLLYRFQIEQLKAEEMVNQSRITPIFSPQSSSSNISIEEIANSNAVYTNLQNMNQNNMDFQ